MTIRIVTIRTQVKIVRQISLTDPPSIQPHDSGPDQQRPQPSVVVNLATVMVLVSAALVFVLACVYLIRVNTHPIAWRTTIGLDPADRLQYWLIGSCYGWVSGLAWMTVLIRRVGIRYFCLAAVALGGAMTLYEVKTLSTVSDQVLWKYVTNTLGMVTFQTIGFHLAGPVGWVLPGQENLSSRNRRTSVAGQFAILDVVACTTAAAALFTLVRQVPTSENAFSYWFILLWAWIVMPIIAYACFAAAMPGVGNGMRLVWLLIGVGSGAVVAAVMSMGEYEFQTDIPAFAFLDALGGYGRIMAGFVATLLAFTLAAWVANPSDPSNLQSQN